MIKVNLIPLGLSRNSRKCIDPVTGAALIGLGGSLLSGLFGKKNNSSNIQMQRETNAMQMDMFQQQMSYNRAAEDRARQYALEDFAMENEYNSPAAQRARYEAAGLNPALMMGDGAAVGQMESTSGSQAPSAPQLGAPVSQDYVSPAVDRFISSMVGLTQAEKTANEAAGIESDNRVKAATEQQRIVQQQLENERRIEEIKAMKLEPKIKEMEIKNLEKQNEVLDDTLSMLSVTFDARSKGQQTMNYLNDRLAAKADEEYKAEVIRNSFLADKETAALGLTRAQIESIAQSIAESVSQVGVNKEMAAYVALQAAGINPETPQGNRAQRFVESQIHKNYSVAGVTGYKVYNPRTGKYELVPVSMDRITGDKNTSW